jgi:hypothetical protein
MMCIKPRPNHAPETAAAGAAWPLQGQGLGAPGAAGRRPGPATRSTRRAALAAVALVAGTALMPAQAQQIPQPKLPTIALGAGMHNIVAEVASTPQQRQIGMMMRTEMAPHEGMLFVFEEAQRQCFWMRNTLLPLSIAFIADNGRIVNLSEMQPKSDDAHCSAEPVRYVLEMNKGWFSKRGIKAGDKLRGRPFGS